MDVGRLRARRGVLAARARRDVPVARRAHKSERLCGRGRLLQRVVLCALGGRNLVDGLRQYSAWLGSVIGGLHDSRGVVAHGHGVDLKRRRLGDF